MFFYGGNDFDATVGFPPIITTPVHHLIESLKPNTNVTGDANESTPDPL